MSSYDEQFSLARCIDRPANEFVPNRECIQHIEQPSLFLCPWLLVVTVLAIFLEHHHGTRQRVALVTSLQPLGGRAEPAQQLKGAVDNVLQLWS